MEVSICIISYNQEKYIAQAIESALMQKYSFACEIIICDDRSSDKTPAIIQSYASKYPERIKVFPATENMGMLRNWERALKLCTGKYIALLEGDDFWIDENKLQKQYNILEAHPDYSFCFTNAHIRYEDSDDGSEPYVNLTAENFTTTDLLDYNFIPTCSTFMRNHISGTFFPPAYFKSPFADWIIHILNSQYGKFHFLNEFSCVYRAHSAGVWGGINEEKQLKNKLLGIECIGEILDKKISEGHIKANRALALQKLCLYYKQKGQTFNYLNYRIKLLLN